MPKLKRRPPGSSPLLNAAVTKAICDHLEIGVPEKYAAEANGVSDDLFCTWMRKGAAGIVPYTEFHASVTRARAKAVPNMHVRGLGGGKGSSAALWILERRYWREYAQHQRIELAPTDPLGSMSEAELDDEISSQRKRVEEFERVRRLKGPPSIPKGE